MDETQNTDWGFVILMFTAIICSRSVLASRPSGCRIVKELRGG
jgi:hypothetical protein